MDVLIQWIQQAFSYIGPFFILLGLLIFVHELGHFLAAKFFGVRVEVFSLGFGKKILKFKRGDTVYCISLIPLGGYVKMFGDNPLVKIPKEEQKFSFLNQPVWPRIVIVLAGPLMNLFFAIFLFATIARLGEKLPAPFLGDIPIESSAYKAGFQSGDQVISLDGQPVESWIDASDYIQENPDKTISFLINRENSSEKKVIKATPQLVDNTSGLSWKNQVGKIDGLQITSYLSMIGVPTKNSLAYRSGLRSLDQIIDINGTPVRFWRQLDGEFRKVQGQIQLKILSHRFKKPKESTVVIDNWNPSQSFTSMLGVEKTGQYIFSVKEGAPAQKAGLKIGDKIIKVDGKDITSWDYVLEKVKSYNKKTKQISFTVLREGQVKTFFATPELTQLMKRNGQEDDRFIVGIYPAQLVATAKPIIKVTTAPLALLKRGVQLSFHWVNITTIGIWKLLTNRISHKNVAGVITIGKVAGESLQLGIDYFLKIMAIISINLFLLNLLPIPVLDGGHLMFFLFEAVSGSPLSLRKMEIAQQIGVILIMALMAFALFNDITNILNPPW